MISVYKGMGISANFKTVFLILRVHLTVNIPSGRTFDFNKIKMLNLTLHLKDSLMKKICGSVRKHVDVFVFASISGRGNSSQLPVLNRFTLRPRS